MFKPLNKDILTIDDKLKPKLERNEDGFDIGIGIEGRGLGITASTENGGTVGIGIGVIGIEINRRGGGEIDMLGELLRMEATRSGCTLRKATYLSDQLINVENEKIPGCDEPEEIKIPNYV